MAPGMHVVGVGVEGAGDGESAEHTKVVVTTTLRSEGFMGTK